MNLITPAKRLAAVRLVGDGVPVTCARPIATDLTADTAFQVMRFMVDSGEGRDTASAERLLARRGAGESCLAPVRESEYRGAVRRGRPRGGRRELQAGSGRMTSPRRITPPTTMSARRPPRWTRAFRTPGLVSPSRWAHGSESRVPSRTTSPTRNRRPTR